MNKKPKKNIGTILLDFSEILFISTLVFIFVYYFLGQFLNVVGPSMHPTLKNGEQLLSEKISLKFNELKRGEVVVFEHPNHPDRLLIKRIIGLPQDEILIRNGKLIINGLDYEEKYLGSSVTTLEGLRIKENLIFRVPENEYVLMGDNREESSDSRDFGSVMKEKIVGRAFLIYYPLQNLRVIKF